MNLKEHFTSFPCYHFRATLYLITLLEKLLLRYRTVVACKVFTPIFLVQLDAERLRSPLDALPGFIPFLVRHTLHLIKTS